MTEEAAIAMRVLNAINRGSHPDPQDVDLLREHFPERRDCEADVLAISAIQEWLHGERAW